jgi:hypothetical protein
MNYIIFKGVYLDDFSIKFIFLNIYLTMGINIHYLFEIYMFIIVKITYFHLL